MTASNETVLAALVRDLGSALEEDALISSFAYEPPPWKIPLVYRPPQKKKTAAVIEKKDRPMHLPGNFTCSLCPERIYPARKFQRAGRLPILVLLYNGSITPKKMRPDRSDACTFAAPEEDAFYETIFQEKGFTLGDFHYQQLPGCHFNPDRSLPADWTRRTEKCLTHVEQAVRAASIQHILISPPALTFLSGKEKSQALTESAELFDFDAGAARVPAHAFRRVDPRTGAGREQLLGILDFLRSRFP